MNCLPHLIQHRGTRLDISSTFSPSLIVDISTEPPRILSNPASPKSRSQRMSDLVIQDPTQVQFRGPRAQTVLGGLPEELANQIFGFVTGERSLASPNCCLVSRDFFILRSPYLVTTAVVALRKKTLRKLQEVMDHPYFRKHVTHLVWDISAFEDRLYFGVGKYTMTDTPRRSKRAHTSRRTKSRVVSRMWTPLTSFLLKPDRELTSRILYMCSGRRFLEPTVARSRRSTSLSSPTFHRTRSLIKMRTVCTWKAA
jgi:hypothetical protein